MGKYEGVGSGWTRAEFAVPLWRYRGELIERGDRFQLRYDCPWCRHNAGDEGAIIHRRGLGRALVRFDGDERDTTIDVRALTLLKNIDRRLQWKDVMR